MTRLPNLVAALCLVAFPAAAQQTISDAARETARKPLENSYLIASDGAIIGPVTRLGKARSGAIHMQVQRQFGLPREARGTATVIVPWTTRVNGQYVVPVASGDLILDRD